MPTPTPPPLPPRLRWGFAGVLAFWLAVMGVVFLAMDYVMQPEPVVVTADGELRIPRARDGHFYVQGTVNGAPITFLVDTGASRVTVSEAFAQRAGLEGGEPAVFQTANGALPGRLVRPVTVAAGPAMVSGLAVGVGLDVGGADRGLLGQNFLSRFEITIGRDAMVLRQP